MTHSKIASSWLALALGFAGSLLSASSAAAGFRFEFQWGDIPRCDDGYPNRVENPRFVLHGVPAGTGAIEFVLTDLDVPSYDHGGGRVLYHGETAVQRGAFTYQSPCPPDGVHTYEWTARALGSGDTELGRAAARRPYPE